ncbi:MAG: CpaF family protein [Firmicutes bacterium]|nr:CpaF family protein [Bacillota bacterium]
MSEDFTYDILTEVRRRFAEESSLDDETAERIITEAIFDDKRSIRMDDDVLSELAEKIFFKTRRRLGIISPLTEDDTVSEIMVNGPDCIFIERNGNIERYPRTFDSVEELEEIMRNIAGDVHREISEMNPVVDARLSDGSRVNGVHKNVAVGGPILTIRKFSEKYMRMSDLVANRTLTLEAAALLETLTECGYNIFVSGGTSSGKTTLLNALAEAIPPAERVIVIEDSMELKLPYIDNIVHMECRNSNSSGKGQVTISGLIKTSLRMRPDRIIVGEVRGSEVADMLQAMNTGHSGSMSTGHGNSVSGMLRRLESMYLMAVSLDINAIRAQIAEGIDIMVHVERMSAGVRKITEIVEIEGYEDGHFMLRTLMTLNQNGELEPTGNKLKNDRKLYLKGGKNAAVLRQYGFVQ